LIALVDSIFKWKKRLCSYDFDRDKGLKASACLRLMQEAGVRHLTAAGLGYEALYAQGGVFVLTRLGLKMMKKPALESAVCIHTWTRRTKGVQYFRNFQFTNDAGEVIIEAGAYWVLVDTENRRVLRPGSIDLPMAYMADETVASVDPPKLIAPDDLLAAGVRVVRYSDLDYNGHVNNAVYADMVCDVLGRNVSEMTLVFAGEALRDDEIALQTAKYGDGIFVRGIHGRGHCFDAQCKL